MHEDTGSAPAAIDIRAHLAELRQVDTQITGLRAARDTALSDVERQYARRLVKLEERSEVLRGELLQQVDAAREGTTTDDGTLSVRRTPPALVLDVGEDQVLALAVAEGLPVVKTVQSLDRGAFKRLAPEVLQRIGARLISAEELVLKLPSGASWKRRL